MLCCTGKAQSLPAAGCLPAMSYTTTARVVLCCIISVPALLSLSLSHALSLLLARSRSFSRAFSRSITVLSLSLSRPHRLLMVRWLNLRSFHGEKPPTQRLAELREALGEVALLIGALQMFSAEVHTAARSRTPATSPDNCLNSLLLLGMHRGNA